MNGQVAFGSEYLLGKEVGSGAMGRVYEASTRSTGEPRAIKILRDEFASEPDVVARFLQERQALQSVSHPNVVTVRDLVVEGDRLGIVMDFVGGGDLRRLASPMTVGEALPLIEQIATGLGAVHSAGIVHRDLKPANVLVDRSDQTVLLRLTDFGVSRLVGHTLTRTTALVGTPGYMAPEVSAGDQPVPATDVYGLGIVLYEMICGQKPFEADNVLAVILAHAQRPVPKPRGIADDLWRMLEAMLAKSPAERPSTLQVAALCRELLPVVGGTGPFTQMESTPPPASTLQEVGQSSWDEPTDDYLTIQRTLEHSAHPTVEAQTTESRYRQSRLGPILGIVATLLILGAAAFLWVSNRGETASSNSVAESMYTFDLVTYPGGVTAAQTWELLPDGLLTSRTVLKRSPTASENSDHYEIIPKSVAADVGQISFVPTPDEVVDADPIVRYDTSGLMPGEELVINWVVEIPAGALDFDRLRSLAEDKESAAASFAQAQGLDEPDDVLVSLRLEPTILTLVVGDGATLSLSADLRSGDAATPDDLLNVTWMSSNTNVATVDQTGRVGAVAAGEATISASFEALERSVEVLVSAPEGGPEGAAEETAGNDTTTSAVATTSAVTTTRPPSTTAVTTTQVPATTTTVVATTAAPTTTSTTTTTAPSCPAESLGGASYSGTATNTSIGVVGSFAASVVSVDAESCQVQLSISWGAPLSGTGAAAGTVTSGGSAQLAGSFSWPDGTYNLFLSVQLSASSMTGSYSITARDGGPTGAVGTGTLS